MDALVAVDDSVEVRQALEQFFDITVHLVTVLEVELSDMPDDADEPATSEAREEADAILADAVAIAEEYGRTVETELITGPPPPFEGDDLVRRRTRRRSHRRRESREKRHETDPARERRRDDRPRSGLPCDCRPVARHSFSG